VNPLLRHSSPPSSPQPCRCNFPPHRRSEITRRNPNCRHAAASEQPSDGTTRFQTYVNECQARQ
jgi:hypothetical protein